MKGVLSCVKRMKGLLPLGISDSQPVMWYAVPLGDCGAVGIEAETPYSTALRVPCWVRTEDGYAVTAVRGSEAKSLKWGPRSIRCPMAKMVQSPVVGNWWLVVDHPEVSVQPGKKLSADFPKGYDWSSDPRTAGYVKYFLATLDEIEAGRRFFGLETVSQCRRLFKAMMADVRVGGKITMDLKKKIAEALERRGHSITDAESYVIDTYIGMIENNKDADDVRQIEIALKSLGRLEGLVVDQSGPESGTYYELPAGDALPPLPGAEEVKELPPLQTEEPDGANPSE